MRASISFSYFFKFSLDDLIKFIVKNGKKNFEKINMHSEQSTNVFHMKISLIRFIFFPEFYSIGNYSKFSLNN